ncbi:MAG TPA: hypothetical protein VKR43_20160 [Bryobacteraceae bacterium]|nr:hypothetical protein [Bryobacteraceae bacterium]
MSPEEDKAARALAACRAAEQKIGKVHELLQNPGQEALDHALAELAEVATVLSCLVDSGVQKGNPAAKASLEEIRQTARRLRPQIEHASRFCVGWIQARLGTGYTWQGSPVFVESEARSSFEG